MRPANGAGGCGVVVTPFLQEETERQSHHPGDCPHPFLLQAERYHMEAFLGEGPAGARWRVHWLWAETHSDNVG